MPRALMAGLVLVWTATPVGAATGHGPAPLHFTHPIITEAPTPDTKLRGNYEFERHDIATGEEEAHRGEAVLEYALDPGFSLEAKVPYTFRDPANGSSVDDLGNVKVTAKLATYRFADQGAVLGGGLELGLPTGDDTKGIGSNNELEVAPFVDAGLKQGPFELTSFLFLKIPTNQEAGEEDPVDLKLAYQGSLLYHLNSRWALLAEVDGETIASGDEDETVVNLSPGIKYRATDRLQFGVSAGFPVSDDEEFDVRVKASVFYHF